MKYNQLGDTDLKLSEVSLGGAAFSSIYGAYDEERGLNLIQESLKRGINYLETSPWYGQGTSETTIGKALKGVPRDSYFIGSKVGRYEKAVDKMFDFSAEKTAAGVDNTLKLLQLDYVDLIQIHDVTFAPDISIILKETLPALERAVRDGKARYIGIADYDIDLMKEIVEESDIRISSVLSYAKSTLFDNRLQNYTKYFKSKGIGVINAAATGMGLLCNQGPQPWHPASDDIKALCRQASEYCKTQKHKPMRGVMKYSKQHIEVPKTRINGTCVLSHAIHQRPVRVPFWAQNVELARLATWYTLSQPDVTTHLCGMYNVDQLIDTVKVAEEGLSDHEMAILSEVQRRFFNKVTLHWDNVELPKYRATLNNSKNC